MNINEEKKRIDKVISEFLTASNNLEDTNSFVESFNVLMSKLELTVESKKALYSLLEEERVPLRKTIYDNLYTYILTLEDENEKEN